MEIITFSFKDLEEYKHNEPENKIIKLWLFLIKSSPDSLKEELKYRKPYLDYYTENINDLPNSTIPYYFSVIDATEELQQYLNNYIMFIVW